MWSDLIYSNLNECIFPEKCEENDTWETNSGGWFLHPQVGDVSGEMTVPATSTKTDSYVGFNNINVDDEIMAAIRTELLNKLPQAQVSYKIHKKVVIINNNNN